MSARVITVTSQKGGVGKTTLTVHLVHRCVERQYRTLLVDLDTQGNATTALAHDFAYLSQRGGSAGLFQATAVSEVAPIEISPCLHLLHGHQYLDEVDGIIDPAGIIRVLRPLLRELPYDRIVLDTPPGMSPRQLAALLLADLVLIPLVPGSFGLAGLTLTLATLKRARQLNPGLRYQAIANLVRNADKAQLARLAEIGELVALRQPPFGLRTAVSQAIDDGVPVWRHRKADRALRRLWLDFAEEVIQ